MGVLATYRTINKWQKVGLWAGCFFIVYTIFGFFILPLILQKISMDKLTLALGRQVSINKIKFNPYSLFLSMEGVSINEKKSDKLFFSIKHALVDLQASSIFRLAPVIREVNIEGLFINTIRNKDYSYNFTDLIPSNSAGQVSTVKNEDLEPPKPFRFSISNIVLSKSTIILNDLAINKTHTLTEMELAIPFVSNLDTHVDIFVTPNFSVKFNGSPIDIKGETKPFKNSQTTIMDFNLNGLDLKPYYAYLPMQTNMDLKNGTMDLFCSIEFAQSEDRKSLPQLFFSGTLELNKIKINGLNGKQFFEMDSLILSMGRSQVLKGDINIEKMIMSSPKIALIKDVSNQLNIYNLIPKEKSNKKQENLKDKTTPNAQKSFPISLICKRINIKNTLVTLQDSSEKKDIFSLQDFAVDSLKLLTKTRMVNISKVSGLNGSLNVYRLKNNIVNIEAILPHQKSEAGIEPEPGKSNTPVWDTKINNLGFNNFSIIADHLISKNKGKVLIENVALNSTGFSTLSGEKADATLTFLINKEGRIDISGKVGVNPLSCDVDLLVDKVNLPGYQQFLSEHMNMIISKGRFSSSGKFSMEKLEEKPLAAVYNGDIDIQNLVATGSNRTEKLIKFKNLGIKNAFFKISPFSGSISTVTIKSPILNVVVYSDGSLNLNKITKSPEQNNTKPDKKKIKNKPKDSSVSLKIGKVIMRNGKVIFNDKSVTPNFKTALTEASAKISGLSSEETIQSDIEINAMVNNHTPIKIKGKINPLKTDFFCDMIVACSDMDLGYLSPYAGKYAGHKIQKGKLSLDLKYLVDKQKLDSTNDLFLDQFEFGQEVESEDAINAPVKLAVSLLKDPMGRISLDLPVKGNLSDPEFSVAGIIIKVIVNLVMKAATAPFSLLGSMFGGGEDLNIVVFDSGASDITAQAGKKIEILVKALSERPGLNLEIAGYASIVKDRLAMKESIFRDKLKAEKLKKIIGQGKSATPLDEIELLDEEFDIFLKVVFKQTKAGIGIKRKDFEKITRDQMIQAVQNEISIDDDELKHLANARALSIKGAILADKAIEAKRVFIVEAPTLEPEKHEDDKSTKEKHESRQIDNASVVIMTLK